MMSKITCVTKILYSNDKKGKIGTYIIIVNCSLNI